MYKRTIPYNDLPHLPPRVNLDRPDVLKAAITSNKALAELKGLARTIPNQTILINALPLQEARTSSEIENVLTTNDKLYEAYASKTNRYDAQTKEVLQYREALWKGFNALKKRGLLTTNLFIETMQTIKHTGASIRRTPGTRILNSKGSVVYTPPESERVIRDLLHNLEQFIHNDTDGIDPLIKLGVIHYQFEAIHPFTDGNGRTGRILNILYLIQQRLLDLPILYLSHFIIENKNDYYALLRGVTEKRRWTEWILFMLRCIEETAGNTTRKILAIRALEERMTRELKKKLPARIHSKELAQTIFLQPYVKVETLVTAEIAKRQTAAEYLKLLERHKFVSSRKVGKEVLYANDRLIALLGKP